MGKYAFVVTPYGVKLPAPEGYARREPLQTKHLMAIIFQNHHITEIRQHGESTYPHECCGFLFGRVEDSRRVVVQTRRAQNQRDDSPQNRYQISPQDYIRADRAAREAGVDIVGFYHSHPDHPARPSQFDLDNAWPELAYVIVGVNQGKAGETTAWMLAEDRDRFLQEELIIDNCELRIDTIGEIIMPKIIIPSALRPFTNGQSEVQTKGATIGEALVNFAEQFPQARRHLYDDKGRLRNFVNIFLGDDDVRSLQKDATPIKDADVISIVPAVAGGSAARKVDHTALRFNQASIILLLALAFVFNLPGLVIFVATIMLVGTFWPSAGLFKLIYQRLIKPAGWLKPKIVQDHLEPHLFAQGLGAIFLLASSVSLLVFKHQMLGWVLVGIVTALAALNLFAGFCAGCFLYYQLNRLGVPAFKFSPVRKEGQV